MFGAARLRQLRRDLPEVYELAEATITFTTEQGVPYYLSMVTFLRGWALSEQGQHEEGIEQMHQGLNAMRAIGNEVTRPSFLILLAEVYGKKGQAAEGLTLLAEAWSLVDTSGQHYHDAEFHRIHGELLRHQADPDEPQAETCFHQALSVAQSQQAKSWELRTATSLARLWQQQDKRDEARKLLAEVYDWFTEGFDTADLKDAKALIDELS